MTAFKAIAAELSKETNADITFTQLGEEFFYIYKVSNFTTILLLAEKISLVSFHNSSVLFSKVMMQILFSQCMLRL